ncbi:MAG TPA: YbaB/EbfC family nucleoid-associated protein [Gemmataceae bacterium]|nr:YbaB/EbfC family nucleoid-associated protein [Gemmataceae bacterium]
MFGNLGNLMGMMKNLPKIQAAMKEMQEKVGRITADGNAGGGMVVVTVNGRNEVTRCVISEEAMKLNDRDVLADLVAAAVNMAMAKVREEVAKATAAMAEEAGLPLPPGGLGGLPGF